MKHRLLTWILLVAGGGLLVFAGIQIGMRYDPRVPGSVPAAEAFTSPVEETTPVNPKAVSESLLRAWEPYTLPVSLGDLGPRLVAAGAIDLERFVQLYERSGNPLTPEQMAHLTEGSEGMLVFNEDNAHFLLNVFWGLGLTNANTILTRGPMVTHGNGEVGGYASTGGWTIGKAAPVVLYASEGLIVLTPEQQARLEKVALAVYRPCCDNPTHFPDCNHGMAMLGLLELMAASGSTEGEMFEAAKVANAFWFPNQTYQLALYSEVALGVPWDKVPAAHAVGRELASGTGFRAISQWLASKGMLGPGPGGGNSC
jgi:hypothetical protein